MTSPDGKLEPVVKVRSVTVAASMRRPLGFVIEWNGSMRDPPIAIGG